MELKVRGESVRATTGGRPLDTDLPLVVFLHGASQDRTLWSLQLRYFSHHGWSVLAPDLPGHGLSAGELLTSIDEMAAWTGELITEAGFESASVVGHSMGALIGIELAASQPAMVEKLVLTGAAGAMPVHESLQTPADANERLAHEMILGWTLAPQSAKGGHPTPGLWISGSLLHMTLNAGDNVLANDLRACNAFGGGADKAAAVSCPALVISGRADRMVQRGGSESLAAALHDGRIVHIDGAGHGLMVEQPDAVLDALIDFLG